PVIASVPLGPLAPPYGVVHIGYTRNRQLRHAWKDFGAWQFEAVADSAVSYDIAVRGDGLASMALADGSRRLIFAERTPGGWVLDTLGTYPGIEMRVSLALAPDASPAIAFVVAGPGGVNSLRYARRSGAGWTITELGADVHFFAPALDFDPQGRPSIVCARPAATISGYEVALYTGDGSGGPFSSAVIDSEGVGPVAHVWDLPRQRPFACYRAQRSDDQVEEYRVAHRDNGGTWRRQTLGEPEGNFNWFVPVSLALDPVGAPAATWVRVDLVLAGAGRNETNACGFVETGRVHVSTQRALAPAAPFDDTVISYEGDYTASGRAVSSHFSGLFDVCMRAPRTSCPEYALLYTEVGNGTVWVPPVEAPLESRLAIGPNPAAPGAVLGMRWAQPRTAEAVFALHDLAGRLVLKRSSGSRPAGAQEFSMSLPRLDPGLYWLRLELDGRRHDSRALIVR
ncbi:MAG: hypothetical protein ABIS67_11110, partial [Candidatus Eisenbacteria bacterium]